MAKERLKTLIGLSRHSGTHAAARSRKPSWLRSLDLNLRSDPIDDLCYAIEVPDASVGLIFQHELDLIPVPLESPRTGRNAALF